MPYRDPYTGQFISREQWESIQLEIQEFDEDFEEDEYDSFDEEEY